MQRMPRHLSCGSHGTLIECETDGNHRMHWPHMLQRQRLGYGGMFFFGLVVMGFGLIPILRDALLNGQGVETVAIVVDAGTTPSSGGRRVGFLRYEFKDAEGTSRNGQSNGYSAAIGESVLVEYAPSLPFIHRLVGEDSRLAVGWRWGLSGFGLLLIVAGVHGLFALRRTWTLAQRLRYAQPRLKGKVVKRSHDGRTIEYDYAAGGNSRRQRSLPLPPAAWQAFAVGDAIELLAADAEAAEVLTLIERNHLFANAKR